MKKKALLPLLQWVPAVTPRYHEPTHLAPLAEFFEGACRRHGIRITCSVPPRMEKTETAKHAIARALLENPALRVALVMYSQTAAEKRSRELRELHLRVGGKLAAGASSRKDWRTGVEEGGVWATSPGGPITGEGFDLIVIDDAVKDRATAESAIEREKLWAWFTDTLYTRLEPDGSVIVIGTRWHTDDLIGRLIADGWDSIVLPAIDGEGRALCPKRFNVAQLTKIKETIGQYGWQSLYMCQPFARGGAVFQGTHFFDALPDVHLEVSLGLDLAYSTRARADFSVAVVLGAWDGRFFVLDVLRMQTTAPDFLARARGLQAHYGGARATMYTGGQERGVLDMAKSVGVGLEVDARPATTDKFTRAQPCAAQWNAGKILLPREAPWLDAFVSEVVGFTGVGDRNDDCVDALSSAFDGVWDGGTLSNFDLLTRARAEGHLGGFGGMGPPPELFDPGASRKGPKWELPPGDWE